MAMGKRKSQSEQPLFIAADRLPQSLSHPFYARLNQLLEAARFDEFAEGLCAKFYEENLGRPGLAPGKYFRLLLIGYFEGIDSERGIAWRCGDSLSLRAFVGYELDEKSTEHSTISRTRRLIDLETHQAVFTWVLKLLAGQDLIHGKMKDGRTHLAHKAEHAVDMDSGAVLAVTLQEADQGDTTTWRETMEETWQNLNTVKEEPELKDRVHAEPGSEIVADKGYHSNKVLCDFEEIGIRSYVSEPNRGRRNWKDKPDERDAVHANRRRTRGKRGRRLMKRRGELIERSFAHGYDTGGMRRTHLRHHCNILKRLLIHIGGFNLSLVMPKLTGTGKPRQLQGRKPGDCAPILSWISALWMLLEAAGRMTRQDQPKTPWRQPPGVIGVAA